MDELEKISKTWKPDPVDPKKWMEHFAKKLGIALEKIQKAFSNEFSGPKALSEPLEIPDQMKISYKYSYGGQSPFFRALRDYGKLLGARCDQCKFTYCPPRKNCSKCYGETRWVELPGTGKIESYTTVFKGTSLVSGKTPFICAYIKLDGSDFILMSNVEMEDPTKASVGMPVRVKLKEQRFGTFVDFYFVPQNDQSIAKGKDNLISDGKLATNLL